MLPCSRLEKNRMDGGAWWATVHGVSKESERTKHKALKWIHFMNWTLHVNRVDVKPS